MDHIIETESEEKGRRAQGLYLLFRVVQKKTNPERDRR